MEERTIKWFWHFHFVGGIRHQNLSWCGPPSLGVYGKLSIYDFALCVSFLMKLLTLILLTLDSLSPTASEVHASMSLVNGRKSKVNDMYVSIESLQLKANIACNDLFK